jgi:hypothetical protein
MPADEIVAKVRHWSEAVERVADTAVDVAVVDLALAGSVGVRLIRCCGRPRRRPGHRRLAAGGGRPAALEAGAIEVVSRPTCGRSTAALPRRWCRRDSCATRLSQALRSSSRRWQASGSRGVGRPAAAGRTRRRGARGRHPGPGRGCGRSAARARSRPGRRGSRTARRRARRPLGDPRPVVAHRELEAPHRLPPVVSGPEAARPVAPRWPGSARGRAVARPDAAGGVPACVVEQVREDLPGRVSSSSHARGGRVGVEVDPQVRGEAQGPRSSSSRQSARGPSGWARWAALVEPREGEQRGQQPVGAGGLADEVGSSRSRTWGSCSCSSASTDPRIVASGVRSWWAASSTNRRVRSSASGRRRARPRGCRPCGRRRARTGRARCRGRRVRAVRRSWPAAVRPATATMSSSGRGRRRPPGGRADQTTSVPALPSSDSSRITSHGRADARPGGEHLDPGAVVEDDEPLTAGPVRRDRPGGPEPNRGVSGSAVRCTVRRGGDDRRDARGWSSSGSRRSVGLGELVGEPTRAASSSSRLSSSWPAQASGRRTSEDEQQHRDDRDARAR